jgi:hypothetical protein
LKKLENKQVPEHHEKTLNHYYDNPTRLPFQGTIFRMANDEGKCIHSVTIGGFGRATIASFQSSKRKVYGVPANVTNQISFNSIAFV